MCINGLGFYGWSTKDGNGLYCESMEDLHGSRMLASLRIDLLQSVKFDAQLPDTLIPLLTFSVDLVELRMKGQYKSRRRLERAVGIFIDKLSEQRSCPIPIRTRGRTERVRETKAEQRLIALPSRRR